MWGGFFEKPFFFYLGWILFIAVFCVCVVFVSWLVFRDSGLLSEALARRQETTAEVRQIHGSFVLSWISKSQSLVSLWAVSSTSSRILWTLLSVARLSSSTQLYLCSRQSIKVLNGWGIYLVMNICCDDSGRIEIIKKYTHIRQSKYVDFGST